MLNRFELYNQLFNCPLLITPDQARFIYSTIADHKTLQLYDGVKEQNTRDLSAGFGNYLYRVYDNKVAVISIVGTLVNRGAWIGAKFGFVSYEGLERQIKAALKDERIQSVVFDFDSPGGDVLGCFELVEQIRKLTSTKKTVAFVNGKACSAAYALASATSEIVTTPSGCLGSIGVLFIHYDYSQQLKMDGVTPSFIYAGSHKIDGNPLQPLSDQLKNNIKTTVDDNYRTFLSTVAKGRGNRLSIEAARKTEARIYTGQTAVDEGLADKVDTFDNIIETLILGQQEPVRNIQKGVKAMNSDDNAAAQAVEGIQKADNVRSIDAAKNEGTEIGLATAYERINAIISEDAIKTDPKRLKAAIELATKSTTMSAAEVVAFVSGNVPKEVPSSPASLSSRLSVPDNDPLLNATAQQNTKTDSYLTAIAKRRYGGKNGAV